MVVFYFFLAVIALLFGFARWNHLWRPFIFLSFFVIWLFLSHFIEELFINTAIGLVFLATALLLTHNGIRYVLIKNRLKKFVSTTQVKISATERDAIECGDTHWEKSLFTNELNWQKLFTPSVIALSPKEQNFLEEEVPALCQLFLKYGLSDLVLEHIKSKGFWAMSIAQQHGGLEFSAYAHYRLLSKIASCDTSLAVTVMVPNSLGPAELIQHYGTEAQQNYLDDLATGKEIPCFALTSLEAGSDAAAMQDTGIIKYQLHNGTPTLGIELNWSKRYTTLAPIATLIGLAFKTYDPEHLIGDKDYLGISCALVNANQEGITIGRFHHPIGGNFANGPHQGKNVFIPMEQVIGGQKMLGQGWKMLMETLSRGRGISLPSLSHAAVQLSLKSTVAYAALREQFHQPLYRFQGIAEHLAPMAIDAYKMRAMSEFNLNLIDRGHNPSIISAMMKYHHTETSRTHVNHAMDIHGGKTVMEGNLNYLSTPYKTLPIAITVEGANILTRCMIIFGQGLLRCHPTLKEEADSLLKGSAKDFNQAIGNHIGHFIRVFFKAWVYNLVPQIVPLGFTPENQTTIPFYKRLAALSASFALITELQLIRFSTKLKFQESISGTLSDILTHLYALSTSLKYYDTHPHSIHDKQLICLLANQEIQAIESKIHQLCLGFAWPKLVEFWLLPQGNQRSTLFNKDKEILIKTLIEDSEFLANLTPDLVNFSAIWPQHPLSILQETHALHLQLNQQNLKHAIRKTPEALQKMIETGEISVRDANSVIRFKEQLNKVLEVNDYES